MSTLYRRDSIGKEVEYRCLALTGSFEQASLFWGVFQAYQEILTAWG